MQPEAVRVALSVPHTEVLFATIVGADGVWPVVIVTELETIDVPQLVVQEAVYVPAPTSLLIPTPKPPDQEIVPPSQPDAVRVALSAPHTEVLFATIVGADGI